MKIELKNIKETGRNLMRRVGYAEHFDHRSRETSYVRRLEHEFYPRFHAYIEESGSNLFVNLHLDMKQASYAVGHMHGGEYEGPLLDKEKERILGLIG